MARVDRVTRLERLERLATPSLPRLFIGQYGLDPLGFTGDGAEVPRQSGESVAELQARCAVLHPGIVVWRAMQLPIGSRSRTP